MNTKIRYAGCCLTGLVRPNNEDNYCCRGDCLPMDHGDAPAFEGVVLPGPSAAFAVFDGMGGESRGEAASFLAAEGFAEATKELRAPSPFPDEAVLCRRLNRRVLDYAAKNRAAGCGSTVAALCFDCGSIHGFNLGDSRCYRFGGGELSALSTDHAVASPITRRSRLTQCLGVPEEEFLVQPALYRADYRFGDLYLLCSDGLTAAVNPVKIAGVLSGGAGLREKLAALRDLVFQRGAEDNVTMILFEIC